MAMPPTSDQRQHADHGQRPAGGQAQSRFARPARPPRQSLRAHRMLLAVEPEPHARIAQQQQEDQHGLLDQRRPLLVLASPCAPRWASARARKK